MKIIVPANFKEYEVEINPEDYKIEMWKADTATWRRLGYQGKLPVCEGIIKGVKKPNADVPKIIADILKLWNEVAFFTREWYPEFCKEEKMKKSFLLVLLPIVILVLSVHKADADYLSDARKAFKKGNYKKVVELYSKACNTGSAEGCFDSGFMYETGGGVQENYKKALKLYSKACNMGIGIGCYFAGHIYEGGWGVQKNYQKAIKLYLEACDMGLADGCCQLGNLYKNGLIVKKDYQKAIKLYLKSCSLGSPSGCNNLGVMYDQGRGVRKDYKKAFKLFLKACNMEPYTKYNNLYYIRNNFNYFVYRNGLLKSILTAEKIKESATGCYILGYMYENGEGVQRDYKKALELYSKACNMGSNVACKDLQKLKHKVSNIPSPFGLKLGLTTEEEFKEVAKRKGWEIEKSGYRIIRDNISNPNVTGYVIVGIPSKNLTQLIFGFLKEN